MIKKQIIHKHKIIKKTALLVLLMLLIAVIPACSATNNNPNDPSQSSRITAITREDGSGTRGAFTELFGIKAKDEEGNSIDHTIDSAEVTNSTSVMMFSVANDIKAIGYISLGSLNDMVKALPIDGVLPSAASIKDGSYSISRPFIIITKGNTSPLTQNFMDYILSSEGQAVVAAAGYVSLDEAQPFAGIKGEGKVVVTGSSSVAPVLEALKEAYQKLNTGAKIEVQSSDSTTGINAIIEGICDIGMSSRALTESELEQGLSTTTIAKDGVVIIVNHDNNIAGLSTSQVRDIYTGKISYWQQL